MLSPDERRLCGPIEFAQVVKRSYSWFVMANWFHCRIFSFTVPEKRAL